MSEQQIDSGLLINNKYVLLKKIGSGSYSTVWLTYCITNSSYVASKISAVKEYIKCSKERNIIKYIDEFKSEYIMSNIESFDHVINKHLHTVSIMNCMACSLYDVISSLKYTEGINFKTVMEATLQICKGLTEFHSRNIIHGDIKPENILIIGNTDQNNNMIKSFKFVEKLSDIKIFNNIKERNRILANVLNVSASSPSSAEEDTTGTDSFDDDTLSVISNESESNESGSNESDSNESESNESESNESESNESESNESESNESGSNESGSNESDETESNSESNEDIIDINYDNILHNIKIQICDMGKCFIKDMTHTDTPKCLHTCYYRAPEISLVLGVSISCDMWALGCTIYELLTGEILFDSDDYWGNTKRHQLFLMTNKLRKMFPENMIFGSCRKDIFFNHSGTTIKGYISLCDDIPTLDSDISNILSKNNIHDEDVIILFKTLMFGLLEFDPIGRLTSTEALNICSNILSKLNT